MGSKRNGGAEAVWRQRLARFNRSASTVADFCRQEGVSSPSFYQWRKRLQHRKSSARKAEPDVHTMPESCEARPFMPVQVVGSTMAEIEVPGGMTIRVPATNTEALRTAILTAGNACRGVDGC